MVRSRLLGIDIDSLTSEEFLNRVDEFVSSGTPHQVSYLNADCLNKCWTDRNYRESISASDLVYADGMSVVWATRLFGHPLPERLNANDLLPEFLSRAAEKGYRLFLVGGEKDVAEKTAKDFQSQFPGLIIAGTHHGYFEDDEEQKLIDTIHNANVDILLVGMGAPKQELWIQQHLKELNVPVAWGVGGLFDYTAKNIQRAPVWMRETGLEWFWRLLLEPGRLWKRYLLGNLIFTFRVGFLIFLDALFASMAWLSAYYLSDFIRSEVFPYFGFLPDQFSGTLNPVQNYLYALPFIIVTWIVICASLDLYRRHIQRTPMDEFNALVKMVFLFLIVSMAVAFLLKGLDLGRSVLILSSALAFCFLVTSRLLFTYFENLLYHEGIGRLRVLVVGGGEQSHKVINAINSLPDERYELLGVIDDQLEQGETFHGTPVLGPISQLTDWAKTLGIDHIFFTNPKMTKRELLNLVIQCGENTRVRQYNLITEMFDMVTDGIKLEGFEDIAFKTLRQGGLTPFEQLCKRAMDIAIASFMLLCFLPIIPIICIAIRVSSPGPAIFRHKRVGKDGEPFIMYKFRTMYYQVNEYQESPITKNDPRVIPVGRWLRRTSMDELPQLINVLRGEMSMVGPRPEMQFIVDSYEPWQRERLSVTPGITGVWQISGRKDLPLHSNLEYDFYYIQNQSLLFDISILLRTIPVVLFGKGAY